MKKMHQMLITLGLALGMGVAANAADTTGAGASFVYPAMSRWAADYNAASKHRVNYQSIGSGGGIAQIKAKNVDFGSTDAPLKPEELAAAGLVQFPSVMGAVVPVVNIPGIAPGQLKLNGAVLAELFLGTITTWNDAKIVALNPDLKLPALRVTVVHRSDGSGTTFNFTNYLSKRSPAWKAKAGEGVAVRWPAGVGGKGNEGVAAYTQRIKGSIGYVELSYVINSKLTFAQMQNAAGKFVSPSVESVRAASLLVDWSKTKDFYQVITDAPGDASWPIAATNFMLLAKQPKAQDRSALAKEFFRWVYANGDAAAEKLGYVALPDAVVTQIETYWKANLSY
jgi:phosphate transport system substrate-binding protein